MKISQTMKKQGARASLFILSLSAMSVLAHDSAHSHDLSSMQAIHQWFMHVIHSDFHLLEWAFVAVGLMSVSMILKVKRALNAKALSSAHE